MNMQIDSQQIMDTIKGLAERPEWCERSMDPERAKIDLILLAARGDVVTVAGMARRWGMPRTSARRVIQAAAALVPWLGTCLDSPKNDHAPIHDADQVDTGADTEVDCPADARKQGPVNTPSGFVDIMADGQTDCPMDSPEASPKSDHAGEREDGGDIEALENLLDTMSTRETIVNPEERARELARRSWEGMPDPVKARVGHDFEEFWKTSAGRFRRDAAS